MRIFTPDAELPFAGHPTLGTAFTLASEGRTYPHTIQTTAIGEVPVEVDLARVRVDDTAAAGVRSGVRRSRVGRRGRRPRARGPPPRPADAGSPRGFGSADRSRPRRGRASSRRTDRVRLPSGDWSAPAASASTCSPCVVRRRDRQDVHRDAWRRRRPGDRRRRLGRLASPRVARTRGHAGRRASTRRRAGRPTELPAPGSRETRASGGSASAAASGSSRGALPAGRLERYDQAGLQTDPESPWSTFTVSISAIPGSKGAELTYAAVSFRNVARPTSTETLQRTCDGSLPRFWLRLKLKQAALTHWAVDPSGSATSNRGGRSFRS